VSGTQAVDRASTLLVEILESEHPLTFTDLLQRSGLAKSTLSRMLSSLERHGLLTRGEDGILQAGTVITRYAHSTQPHEALIRTAQSHLEAIGAASGETVNLAILEGDEVEQIAQIDCTYLVGSVNWVGQRVPMHCSALGKVFLAGGAQLPGGRLARLTPLTITRREDLDRELALVRERGWAVTESELEPGLTAIAAPIHGVRGNVVAAISVSGPSMRLTKSRIADFGALLHDHGREISGELGYTGYDHRILREGKGKAGAA
jgi:IclR family transcriptional regulator, acetate operon repressor